MSETIMDASLRALEFDRILAMLSGHALSEGAKEKALALTPQLNLSLCRARIQETTDARRIIESEGLPPLAIMEGLSETVRMARIDTLLTPAQLLTASQFSNTCRRMAQYLRKCETLRVELSLAGRGFLPIEDMEREIDGAIRGDTVADSASTHLRDVRRKIEIAADQIKARLQNMLRSHPQWYADGYIASRAGRQTLPVKAQYRAMVPGGVIDRSQTGGTLFIEPQAIKQAQDEIDLLILDEENEVRRILYALSALVADAADAICENMRLMEKLDFAFAKGKLSLEMDARAIEIEESRTIDIRGGRHPLIQKDKAVPLDFALTGPGGVIITGPNTGGKTVTLKTIGLFSAMAQSGLHIPAQEGSALCMMNQVLCDIGDGQSISENLSTFSSHMTRVLQVLTRASRESLILLDELGSGTDPAEGMGLAIAVLDELVARNCLFVVTTHYPEVKEYARKTPGVINARMTFDSQTLKPLYRLQIGEAGESCALHIARRLGFPDAILRRAEEAAYRGVIVTEARAAMRAGEGPRITDYDKPRPIPPRALSFTRGDSVRVYPEGQIGIVCEESDDMGTLCVQLPGHKKKRVSYKRLKRLAPAAEMYPPDYDFSIVFDTVENRKAAHTMSRKFDRDAVVVHAEGEEDS